MHDTVDKVSGLFHNVYHIYRPIPRPMASGLYALLWIVATKPSRSEYNPVILIGFPINQGIWTRSKHFD